MYSQVKNLKWALVLDRSRRRRVAHGRWELRSMRTLELAPGITPFHLSHATTAIRVIRTRTIKGKTSRETVYYATDLRIGPDLTPAALAFAIRRHWAIENSSHHVRERTFAKTPVPLGPEPHHRPSPPSVTSRSACSTPQARPTLREPPAATTATSPPPSTSSASHQNQPNGTHASALGAVKELLLDFGTAPLGREQGPQASSPRRNRGLIL